MRLAVLLVIGCGRIDFQLRDDAGGDASQASCISTMAGAGGQTCVVSPESVMLCKGNNIYGEVGDGTMMARTELVPVLDNVAMASPGEFNSGAVRRDGTFWTWGRNLYAQLGDDSTIQRSTPAPVAGLSSIAEGVISQFHACARNEAGQVWCWGDNPEGSIGDGMVSGNPTRVPKQIPGLVGIDQIVINDRVSCGRSGGTLQCWGSGGNVGDGTLTVRPSPVPVTLPRPITQVFGSCDLHTCAILDDRTAWCWGRGDMGQIGDGARVSRPGPAQVASLSDVVELGLGAYHTCARTSVGDVYCWGADDAGQRTGTASGSDALLPERVPFVSNVDQLAVGCRHTCARSGNLITCWGTYQGSGFEPPTVLPVPGC